MCEQCSASTIGYTKNDENDLFLGKWALVRATRDGNWMKKDQWGLVDCNDPDVIFTITARPNPFWNLTTEEADLLPKELSDIDYEWLVSAEKFSEEFWMGIEAPRLSLHICSRFMLQALEHGFDPKSRHRNKSQFELWLFQKLGEYMFTHSTPLTDNPHKEETLADGINT